MLKRIAWLLIAFPLGVLLVTLAVANRHSARLVLDPFRPESPVLSISLPFYVWIFGTLLIGVLLGGAAVWMGQSRWRRAARTRTREAIRWKAEASRLTRERDRTVAAARQLAPASH